MHGLGANPDHAWVRYKNEKERLDPVNWLIDLLPHTLRNEKPSIYVRVFCFNYQSAWIGTKTSKNRLETVADGLLDGIKGHKVLQPCHCEARGGGGGGTQRQYRPKGDLLTRTRRRAARSGAKSAIRCGAGRKDALGCRVCCHRGIIASGCAVVIGSLGARRPGRNRFPRLTLRRN